MSCPNFNSPQWQALVGKIGVFEAFREFRKNGDNIPDASNYQETFKGVNSTLKIVNALTNPKANILFKNFYLKGNKDKFFNELIPIAGAQQVNMLKEWEANNPVTELGDMTAGILAEMSFTVKIEKGKKSKFGDDYTFFERDGRYYLTDPYDGEREISYENYLNQTTGNSSYYSNLTVPGGTNYTENEIATPDIEPSIKGHAHFATKNGIGWFRSDDRRYTEEIETEELENDEDETSIKIVKSYPEIGGPKTRRILEVQSDLFQKGRDKQLLVPISEKVALDHVMGNTSQEMKELLKSNQFLQLLNKDNNWVTFFIKSIIQDSIRKGYEKVLFPSGDTASKVEGHTTLEQFKKEKQDRINKLKSELVSNDRIQKETDLGETYYFIDTDNFTPTQRMSLSGEFPTRDTAEKVLYEYNVNINLEILQLEKELSDVEANSLAQLKPIWNFYENMVTNILKKNYRDNVTTITDEHGNTWNEVTLTEDIQPATIMLQSYSKFIEEADRTLDSYLSQFLSKFGVKVEQYKNLQKSKGLDGLGGADVLNKLIWVAKDRKIDTLPEEAGHMLVMLMGEKHPYVEDLMKYIERWSGFKEVRNEYLPKYNNEKQVKIEAVGKLVAQALVENYNGAKPEQSILQTLRALIEEFIDKINSLFTGTVHFSYPKHLAEKIAIEVLNGNSDFIANVKPLNEQLDYNKALFTNPFAKDIIQTFTRLNAKMTGSLAISKQGESIYRPSTEPIHDIDFVLGSESDIPKIEAEVKSRNGIVAHDKWWDKTKTRYTLAYIVPARGFTIEPVKVREEDNFVEQFILRDSTGQQVETNANNVVTLDFFHDTSPQKFVKGVSSWQDVYSGKMLMGDINERFFKRDKDQKDYVLSNPVNRKYQKSEFVYLQNEGGATPSKASPKTIARVKGFLKRLGINVEAVQAIMIDGKKIGANGMVNGLQKLIQYVEGLEDTVLPEEAMHIAVDLIEQSNPELYKRMLSAIGSYNIYREVVRLYSTNPLYQKDGKPDVLKLKKEAIGKLLVEHLIKKEEGMVESPENMARTQTFWQQILTWLKNLFTREISPFDEALDQLDSLEGELSDETYLQATPQEALWDKVTKTQKEMALDRTDPNASFYTRNGIKVSKRVHDFVNRRYNSWFKDKQLDKAEWQKAIDDYKKDKGTDIHADMEDIFHRYIDDNGYVRDTPLAKTNVSKIDPNSDEHYLKLENYFKGLLENFRNKEGKIDARFKSEVMIHDSRPGKDIAGTIDFLAIKADGTAIIYDWKSMTSEMGIGDDVPWYKKQAWDMQLSMYREILQTNYGIKKFGTVAAIPIVTQYRMRTNDKKDGVILNNIAVGDPDFKKITQEYLLPVPISVQTSGDEKLDYYIEKLRNLYKVLSSRKVTNNRKDLKAEQLNAIMKAIRHLQIKGSIVPFLDQAEVFTKQIQRVLSQYEALKDKELTEKEYKEMADDLNTSTEAFNTYSNIDVNLRHLFDLSKEEDKVLYERVKDIAENTRIVASQLSEANKDFVIRRAAKRGVHGIEKAERVVKGAVRWFRTLSDAPTKALQLLWDMKSDAVNKSEMQTDLQLQRLGTLKEAYDKWAKGKGLSIKDMFSPIMKKDSHELIDTYNPEFYKELRAKVAEGDTKWIKDNLDTAALVAAAKEKLAERIKEIESTIYPGTAEEQNIRKNIEKERALNQYTEDKSLYKNYNFIKQFPKPTHHSEAYKFLLQPNNKPALDFFNFITEWNERASEYDYIDVARKRTFLPFVRKTMAEKVVFGGSTNFLKDAVSQISISDAEIGYGDINPFTGKIENNIPIYFTREQEGEQYSTDLFKVMALFINQVIEHRNLSNLRSEVELVLKLERSKGSILTNMVGSVLRDDNGNVRKSETNEENSQLFEDFVKAAIYKQKYINTENIDLIGGKIGSKLSDINKAINKKLGVNWLPEDLGDDRFSLTKTIDGANKLFQLKVLGLNVATSISNLLGANFQAMINSGKYYTKAEFMRNEAAMLAHKAIRNNNSIHFGLIDYFMPLTEGTLNEKFKDLSESNMSQQSISEFLMILMRKADHLVQYANFITMVENSMLDENNKIVNIREYLRSKPEYASRYTVSYAERKRIEKEFEAEVVKLREEKSLVKLAKIENGKLVIPGVERTSETVRDFRALVKQIAKNATANVTEDDMSKIRMNVITRSMMVFKNWIPRMIDVRAGELRYSKGIEAWQWGRARMVASMLSTNIFSSIANLRNMMIANDKGVDELRKLYEKKKSDFLEMNGLTEDEDFMSEEEFFDLVRNNIRAQMREVIILGSMFTLFMGIFGFSEPPKDPAKRNFFNYMKRLGDKVLDEISFYYNPINMQGVIGGSIFPSLGIFTDFAKIVTHFMREVFGIIGNDEEEVEKAKPTKYVMKAFPITKEMVNYIAIFSPELAKEMGIRINTESRAR